ncbi:hypothetical protein [Amycolatopsis sp. GM8]|uniref:hypothetical protein n=1 Tax=Amycolatopsis sp. GM8 TaxID=2896530 RepID=UPI001F4215E3|nr:hypothetical protein [Amycolatopsis sp. GM8]
MDAHRLRDKADARRLLQEAHREAARHHPGKVLKADEVREPSGAGTAELVGDGGRIELDPGEIAAADAELRRRSDELSQLLAQAQDLEAPLRDGTGPVSGHLRKAFGQRGSADTGVQAVLRSYLDELGALRDAIRQAAAGHAENDANAKDIMATLNGELGE